MSQMHYRAVWEFWPQRRIETACGINLTALGTMQARAECTQRIKSVDCSACRKWFKEREIRQLNWHITRLNEFIAKKQDRISRLQAKIHELETSP